MTDNSDVKAPPSSDTDLEAQEKALDQEEKLEAGLEGSMDASDPPAVTAPGDHGDPVPSSGFPDSEKDEKPGK